jgi:ribosome biogenesis GTPase
VLVETQAGQRLICHPRGKQNRAVVGDLVQWMPTADEGTIEAIEPRHNLFFRQDELRIKSFASNLDLVLVLLAAEPEFSEYQLARALIAAEAARIEVLIALNKSDLEAAFTKAWGRLQAYRNIGYETLPLCLKPSHPGAPRVSIPMHKIDGKVTLVIGPSGAGKSTLINQLVPDAQALTGEISKALSSGKHTTTHTRWYWIADQSPAQARTALIDSPGFQEFGLLHISPTELAGLMPDIKAHAQDCKFHNCTHLHEPGCSVIAAGDRVNRQRYKIYKDLFEELSTTKY